MKSLDRLKGDLKRSRQLEKQAATRLRRAQTIFDKYYQRSQRMQDKIETIERQTNSVAARLLGDDDDDND